MKKLDFHSLDWRGWISFGAVLIVALALSWWSLYSLAVTFYNVPPVLAGGISIAFDGAALFVADLASKYARTEDSGLATKFATYLFVAASTYLNVEHAILLGYGIPGMVLFGAPPVIAGILFELYLRYIHRNELRSQNLIAKRMPAFGKLAWMMYPGKTLNGFRKVILHRLNGLVTNETNSDTSVTHQKSVTSDKKVSRKSVTTGDKSVTESSDKKVTLSKTSDSVTAFVTDVTSGQEGVTDKVSQVTSNKSVSLLVRELYAEGVTDKRDIRDKISDIKGQQVSLNTVTKAMSRMQ